MAVTPQELSRTSCTFCLPANHALERRNDNCFKDCTGLFHGAEMCRMLAFSLHPSWISRISRLDSQVIANSPTTRIEIENSVENLVYPKDMTQNLAYDHILFFHFFFHISRIFVTYRWPKVERPASWRSSGAAFFSRMAGSGTHKPPCFWDIIIIYPMYIPCIIYLLTVDWVWLLGYMYIHTQKTVMFAPD